MNKKTLLKRALGLKGKVITNNKGYEVLQFFWGGKKYELSVGRETYSDGFNDYGYEIFSKTGRIRVIIIGVGHNYFKTSEYLSETEAVEWFAERFNKQPANQINQYGIYGYYNELDECVYIGKDSHINTNERHKQHMQSSEQLIDRALKNNKLEYKKLFTFEEKLPMDKLEVGLIKFLKPQYNVIHNKGEKSGK